MDKQIILACDDNGKFLGEYTPKELGHTGLGKRHLAVAVLLYNNKGQVLLQKRKHKIFDKVWDITGATHLLHRQDGTDETLIEATLRCLKTEYDIDVDYFLTKRENISLKNLGGVAYFSKDGDFCENEYCYLMVGEYNGSVNLNPQFGYEYKWIDKKEFLKDLEQNPQNYTPWAQEGVKVLKK